MAQTELEQKLRIFSAVSSSLSPGSKVVIKKMLTSKFNKNFFFQKPFYIDSILPSLSP